MEREYERLGKALSTFHAGLVAEDAAAIRPFLYAKDDPHHLLVEAQTRRIVANVRFLRAIRQEWDIPHGVNPFSEFHIFLSDDFMAMSSSEIEGDHATVPPDDWKGTDIKAVPPMIRVRGVWKINLTPTPTPAATPALAAAVSKYAEVIEQTALAMRAGRLKTVEDVKRALDAAPKFEKTDYTPDLILSLPAAEEQASLKEVAGRFAAAVEKGDHDAAKRQWHIGRPVAEPLAQVLTRQFIALAQLRRATTEKLGVDAGRRLPLNDLPSDAVKGATEDIRQDGATLRWVDAGGTERDIDLVRVNGTWRLSLVGWLSEIEHASAEEIADTVTAEADFNAHVQRTTERVRAGKLHTVDEIVRSLRE